jgi:hypothetical protein
MPIILEKMEKDNDNAEFIIYFLLVKGIEQITDAYVS